MSEQEPEIEDISIHVEFASSDAPRVTIRQVYIGLAPAVLIEPSLSEDETSLVFNITAVDIEADDLADMLETLAGGIRQGSVDEEDES